MKTNLFLLLILGVSLRASVILAQALPPAEPAAPAPPPAEALAAAQPAAPAAARPDAPVTPAEEEDAEVIPLIVFEDTPLDVVINALARQAGINFVAAPNVFEAVSPEGVPQPTRQISIRFENVTAVDALETVLENNNLQLVPNPKTKIARITARDPAAPEPLITRVIQLKYSSPTNMIAIVKSTLSPRGQVLPDMRTSQIVVVATEAEMEGVEELVEKLDSPTMQVLIEARIMETSRSPSSIKGIDWSGTLQAQNFGFGNGFTSGTTTTTIPGAPVTTTDPGGRPITTTPRFNQTTELTTENPFGGGGLSYNTLSGLTPNIAFLSADGVRGVLSFLNTDSDTEVVATPRAVTLDNHMARLEVTRAFPIFTTSPGSANTPATTEVTYTNLGTILEVTPRIAANSNINLTVTPEVSNIDSKDRQTVGGLVNEANVYAIRKIQTQVLIPSGNTLVMGGLMSDNLSKGYTKVPFLGDIPGPFGYLFRRDSRIRNKANLIIFITPTIVQDYDYQFTPSDYLRNRLVDETTPKTWVEPGERPEEFWDSGKPGKWGKSKQSAER